MGYKHQWILYNKCHKINPSLSGSYIDSPDWIKNKKATTNPNNKKDNKCLQHAATVALNHKQIEKDPQGISKNKPLIGTYNWEGINYPSEKNYWKKFKKNNLTITLNVLHAKKRNYALPVFQKLTQIVKSKLFF